MSSNRYKELVLKKLFEHITEIDDLSQLSDEEILNRFMLRYNVSDKEIQDNVREFISRQIKEKQVKGFSK